MSIMRDIVVACKQINYSGTYCFNFQYGQTEESNWADHCRPVLRLQTYRHENLKHEFAEIQRSLSVKRLWRITPASGGSAPRFFRTRLDSFDRLRVCARLETQAVQMRVRAWRRFAAAARRVETDDPWSVPWTICPHSLSARGSWNVRIADDAPEKRRSDLLKRSVCWSRSRLQ